MRISQLVDRSGVPATTLRYYETAGLLPAGRTPAGYRVYGEDAVERLAFIGAAKHLGLALQEIGELLGVWEAGVCADVKADLRPRLAARLGEAERRVAELTAFTGTVRAALAHLDTLPDRAGPCDSGCVLPEQEPAGPDGERWRTAPVACSLTGDAVGERVARWRAAVDGAERAAIPDGVRLTLPARRAAEVAGLAAAEQECCAFFDFRLHLDGRALHLEVRAPAAGAGMLADLFGPCP